MLDLLNRIGKALLAGIFIGCASCANASAPDKTVGALVFSFGIILVMLTNADLFTGKVGKLVLKEPFTELIFGMGIMLPFNLFGCWLVKELSGIEFAPVAQVSFLKAVITGIMVICAINSKQLLGAVAAVFFFVIIGCPHCIACIGQVGLEDWCVVALGNVVGAVAMEGLLWLKSEKNSS